MSFDSHSLERLHQLGRQLPKPLDVPNPSIDSSKKSIGKKHPIETEDDPNNLFKELINASIDGKVPKHLINRLKETEKKQAICKEVSQVINSIGISHGAGKWKDLVMVDDRIADSIFQQIQTRPQEYSILATLNLNGDYISDAAAAIVGGLGMAPGANIGDKAAIFEATHGTAPKHAGLDRINPGSVILSGVMMLEFLGWQEAADLITKGLGKSIADKKVTYDLARLMSPPVEPMSCSGFAQSVIARF